MAMADNYLEKRYAEVFGANVPKAGARRPGLDILLARNRSYRGYDKNYEVHPRQLETILAVNTKLGSGMNAQRLRFHPVVKGPQADAVLANIGLGAALPELHLPLPGSEPEAFIVVCATCEENPIVDIDLAQTGIGSASCGPEALPKYKLYLKDQPKTFTFRIEVVTK